MFSVSNSAFWQGWQAISNRVLHCSYCAQAVSRPWTLVCGNAIQLYFSVAVHALLVSWNRLQVQVSSCKLQCGVTLVPLLELVQCTAA